MKKSLFTLFIFLVITSGYGQDLSDIKICIDPGHGGHESDDRYIPETGFWESEGNLTKALKLDTMLTNLGAWVILTRYGNSNVADDPSLSERAAIANANNVDYFHSIHSNGYNGQLNYTLMLYRGWDFGVSGYNYGEYVTGPLFEEAGVMSNIMAEEIYTANRTTAKHVRGDWSFYDWTDSQGNKMGLGVLRTLNMPGTLSEGSFHDYIPESWRLQNLDYRKKESWALANSFIQFYEQPSFEHRLLAGRVKDPYQEVDYYYISSLSDKYKPINNITVTLNPIGKTYNGDEMNNGFFFFDSLNPGNYELIVEAENYYSDTVDVTVGSSFYNFKDFFLISKIPPYVVSTAPANSDTTFPAWEPIIIKFSRPMNKTLTENAISFPDTINISFEWREDSTKLTIEHDSLEYLTNYTLTISGDAEDSYGHPFDGNGDGTGGDDFVLSFRTGPEDMFAPEVVQFTPAAGQKEVELRPIINIEFDEEIDESTLPENVVQLYPRNTTNYLNGDIKHYVVSEKSLLCFFPEEDLTPDQYYVVKLNPGFSDLLGNQVTIAQSIIFKTGVMTFTNIKVIDNFESGLTSNWWQPQGSGSTTGQNDNYTSMGQESNIVNYITQSASSMKLSYGWNVDAENWLIREYLAGGTPRSVTFDDSYIMQVYIFGDGSKNKFRFAVDDNYPSVAAEDHEVSQWYTIDWIGWKLISWDMANDSCSEWVGDGNLDGTLRFDSFQLTYNSEDPEVSEVGVLYFDDLRLVKLEKVSIEQDRNMAAKSYTLEQNYPNPFNMSTTISFILPKSSYVNLSIYNTLGEKVKTLISEYFSSGYWQVVWDGKDESGQIVPSGLYFYHLNTPECSLVKKMILVK
jgi:N-acetylmuramoyl-L-alanine amidase